jgi:ribonuclease BN (tRNA processing enzyme)
MLGVHLRRRRVRPRISILFTHYHWDHIQGLPFFVPGLGADTRFELYGESKEGVSVEELLRHQMEEPYFPVALDEVSQRLRFCSVRPRQRLFLAPGVAVETAALAHPNGAIGYRVETGLGSVCVVTDHEHPRDGLDESVVAFARGATVLVHEAQYTPEEKRGPRAGWGHSSWEEAALTAREAGVGLLYLSHHDPARTDREVAAITSRARRIFPATEAATERTVYRFAGWEGARIAAGI